MRPSRHGNRRPCGEPGSCLLIGDAGKAKKRLKWEPTVRFKELATMMVDADLCMEKERLEGTRIYPKFDQG